MNIGREILYRIGELWDALDLRGARLGVALGCVAAILLLSVALARGWVGGSQTADERSATTITTPDGQRLVSAEASSSAAKPPAPAGNDGGASGAGGPAGPPEGWVTTRERVKRHEALPCTGAKDPINFEIFSAGPSIAGEPMTDFQRRCGGTTPADEPPANFTSYIYGDCEITESDSGCTPPLEIQTWPACERSLPEYSFGGKPIPHTRLPSRNGAEVQEIVLPFGPPRIEVYTKSSTVVIFANDPALAKEALGQLRSQEEDKPPATQANELDGEPEGGLASPADEATEGELQCLS
jgi:hypothetical protein